MGKVPRKEGCQASCSRYRYERQPSQGLQRGARQVGILSRCWEARAERCKNAFRSQTENCKLDMMRWLDHLVPKNTPFLDPDIRSFRIDSVRVISGWMVSLIVCKVPPMI